MSTDPRRDPGRHRAQREQLAQTVDQLGHKLDVKAQSKAKVEDVKAQTQAKRRRGQGAGRTTDDGKPRPEVLGAAAAVVVGVAMLIWLRRRR